MLSTRFVSTIRQSGCSVLKKVESVSYNQVGGVSSVRVFSSATTSKDGSSWTTKSDIIRAIAEEHDLSVAKSKRVVDSILDMIAEAVVEKKSVRISGFGSFLHSERKSRNIFNIGTKAISRIPASNNMRFRPSKLVKNNLNRK
eukprot:scaffold76123_cov44-Attheya_sp.AAC.2